MFTVCSKRISFSPIKDLMELFILPLIIKDIFDVWFSQMARIGTAIFFNYCRIVWVISS
jgi:hypothetical protein